VTEKVRAKSLGCSCLGQLIALGLILAALAVGILSGQRLSAFAQYNFPEVVEWIVSSRSALPPRDADIGVTHLADEGRMNILVMGLDQREEETGPWHTDILILATVDPDGGTAGALSIPRDLWVPIPSFGEDRINAAYFYGDMQGGEEDGARLAMETVEQSFGVPIHRYVCFNFVAFRAIIDAIGGITVDVEETIWDDHYPDGQGGTTIVTFERGLQFMDGQAALRYVRTRYGGSDFDRVRRQQKVLWAVRDKVRTLDILPKVPGLIQALGENVQTNLELREIVALAQFELTLSTDSIVLRSVDASMVKAEATTSGSDVLVPNWEAIRGAVRALEAPPLSAETDAAPALVERLASIEVLNGTSVTGLAQRTSQFLEGRGYRVILYTNADRFDYQSTFIVDLSGDEKIACLLADLLGVPPELVCYQPSEDSPVDIRIILGEDFVLPDSEEVP
jgi:LCP family protein required for cell wall assembly